ncbi:MAG: KAP family NTPase [Deltaproteobacteria bacterium]|nr:KAP family NTPase [Deltaproteobacteria bacterium]
MAAIGLLAYLVLLVAGRLQRERVEAIAAIPAWWALPFASAAAALIAHLSARRVLAAADLRHPLTYPPYWMGIALGIAGALLSITNIEVVSRDFHLTSDTEDSLTLAGLWIIASTVLAFVAALFAWTQRHPSVLTTEPGNSRQSSGRERLEAWLRDDTVISDPAEDLFGHAAIARRMATRIATNPSPAQALVGPLGSGKSTVLALTRAHLLKAHSSAHVSIVEIGLWPYDSSRSAVEGILGALVEALSQEVSTNQLAGLPAAYGAAIARMGGFSDWIPPILHPSTNPSDSLFVLDEVATAIGHRFVLWVEDLERFAAGKANAPVSESEIERLGPIRALLFGLDQLRSISVVTSTTDLLHRFDIEKIARYVERIPEIRFREARRVVSEVRQHLLDTTRVIDPSRPFGRAALGWDTADPADGRMEAALVGDRIVTFASAIAVLANTPRTLKQGLRRVRESWILLSGEIDLDEPIALSIIQASYPSVFALIDQRIGTFRRVSRQPENAPAPMQEFGKALDDVDIPGPQKAAIKLIVDEIFGPGASRRPQGVANTTPADYWQRFLAPRRPLQGESDQTVLKILASGRDSDIVEALVTPSQAPAVEAFCYVLDRRRTDRLILSLAARVKTWPHGSWHEGNAQGERYAPGLTPLWRILRQTTRDEASESALLATVIEAMEGVAKDNLALMYDLSYWFGTSTPKVSEVFNDRAHRSRIKARARELLVERFQGHPESLAEQLKDTPPFFIAWICWTVEAFRSGTPEGVPFQGWHAFAPTLVAALTHSPNIVAPQLAALVVIQKGGYGAQEWLFRPAQHRTLFGDSKEFVAGMREYRGDDPRVQAVVDADIVSPADLDIGPTLTYARRYAD